MLIVVPDIAPLSEPLFPSPVASEPFAAICAATPLGDGMAVEMRCGDDTDDDDEDLGDEEDLSNPDPDVDEESSFDDFDDEFDDDFEEEENDPDWDHPEDTESDEPPPAKGPGKKK